MREWRVRKFFFVGVPDPVYAVTVDGCWFGFYGLLADAIASGRSYAKPTVTVHPSSFYERGFIE
jgi:hypothetical protein